MPGQRSPAFIRMTPSNQLEVHRSALRCRVDGLHHQGAPLRLEPRPQERRQLHPRQTMRGCPVSSGRSRVRARNRRQIPRRSLARTRAQAVCKASKELMHADSRFQAGQERPISSAREQAAFPTPRASGKKELTIAEINVILRQPSRGGKVRFGKAPLRASCAIRPSDDSATQLDFVAFDAQDHVIDTWTHFNLGPLRTTLEADARLYDIRRSGRGSCFDVRSLASLPRRQRRLSQSACGCCDRGSACAGESTWESLRPAHHR